MYIVLTDVFQCFQGDRVDEADRSEIQDDGVCVFLHIVTAGGVCVCLVPFLLLRVLLWLEAAVQVTVAYCCCAVVIDDVFIVCSFTVHRLTHILHGDQHSC